MCKLFEDYSPINEEIINLHLIGVKKLPKVYLLIIESYGMDSSMVSDNYSINSETGDCGCYYIIVHNYSNNDNFYARKCERAAGRAQALLFPTKYARYKWLINNG